MTAKCDYCAYMASVALPDHSTEVRSIATGDALDFGADVAEFRQYVTVAYNKLTDHATLGTSWGQRIFVRQLLREFMGDDLFEERLHER